MATFLYLIKPKEPNKLGKYQIYMQVTRHSKSLLIGMKHTVDKEHWQTHKTKNGVSYTDSAYLNNLLLARLSTASNLVISWDNESRQYSALDVKQELLRTWGMEKPIKDVPAQIIINDVAEEIKKPKTFFEFAILYLANMKAEGKYNVSTERSRVKHFKEFLKGKDIAFTDITVSLIQTYKAHLKSTLKIGKDVDKQKSVKDRTVINHLITIRTIYNQGITNGAVTKNDYPFGKGKVSIKIPSSLKVGLNQDEVKKLEEFANSIPEIMDFSFIRERKINNGLNQRLTALKKKNPDAELNTEDKARLAQIELWREQYLKHAVNVWLVSFYFAGMRISDTLLLKWSDFQNGRLYYTMGKNQKGGSLKVPEKIQAILEQYKKDDRKNDLVFPELKVLDSLDDKYTVKLKIANADGRLNDALKIVAARKEITKNLNPHGSRHAFGNIAGDNISIQKLQQLYRHTNITTTVNYQGNFMHKDADEALDTVIGF